MLRPLTIVAGKGGVGRSTTAAALALNAAGDGKRVLAVDVMNRGILELADRHAQQFDPDRLVLDLDPLRGLSLEGSGCRDQRGQHQGVRLLHRASLRRPFVGLGS